jgi:hypothetical protein
MALVVVVMVADFVIVAMVLVMVVDITILGWWRWSILLNGGDGYSPDGGGNHG